MKKRVLIVLLLCCSLLSLCACGKKKPDYPQIAQYYTDNDFTAQYTVTTHAGFYAEYQLDCRLENGSSRVTILAPDSVAGVCAVLQGDGAVLQYEDVSVDTLLPEIKGYAPMDALHVLIMQMKGEEPDFLGYESDKITLEYRNMLSDGSECMKTISLHPKTLDLQNAECYLDGSLVLALHMEQLVWDS